MKEKILSLKNKKDDHDSEELSVKIQKSLDNIIKQEGYIEYKINKNKISNVGGNYNGILTEVEVSGKTKDGDKETNIFMKQIILNNHSKFLNISNSYLNEAYAYNTLLKIYDELQDEALIPDEERFKTAQSFDETNEEAIFLENLSKKGFKTIERMQDMPIEFVELSIKQIAKFHGLSMVFQNKRPESYRESLKILKPTIDYYCDGYLKCIKNIFDVTYKYLSTDTKEKLERYNETFVENTMKHWDSSAAGCCICHGDYNGHNVMYKEEDGVIQEVIPIDFQYIKCGRPMNDFMAFVFLQTDRDFRKKHLNNLKDLYYETLEQFLKYFDMDVKVIFPRNEYEIHFKFGLEYGLLRALCILPLVFIEKQDAPDANNVNKLSEIFRVNHRFKDRIQGIVDDFIEWNIIKDN